MKTDNKAISDHSPISVGIVGAGQIVSDVHVPILLSLPNVSLEWIADSDWQKAKSVARAYKLNYCTPRDNLKNLAKADIILLAIPYGARDPYYEILRERQCAIYVEKPFANSLAYHKKISAGFFDYQLGVGFQRRSWGPTLLIKQLIDSNLFGPLRSVQYGFGGPGIVTSGRYSTNLQLAGGGILFETGVHGIDALLFVTGAIASNINRVKMVMDEGFDLHTEAELELTTKRAENIACHITVSCLQETIERTEFTFDQAVVSYSLFSEGQVTVKPLGGGGSYLITTAKPLSPSTPFQTFAEHWSKFIHGVHTQQANWTSAAQTTLTTAVVEKLYELGSARDRKKFVSQC